MSTIVDDEFGEISIRTIKTARNIRARVAPNGRLSITAPSYTPKIIIKGFINSARSDLRNLVSSQTPNIIYDHGGQIGKSHTLIIKTTSSATAKITMDGQQIILLLPVDTPVTSPEIQRLIRDHVIKALRKEAKNYLPRRLKYLAEQHGFNYERTRFSHASGRWGSCSSTGTISLNIALMKLPFELIDYVIIHELAHTRQMNHSEKFWSIVAQLDPHYKIHRKLLKKETPSI